jgi:hypothetical protein
VRAFFAAGLLLLVGCPLPSNVLYRCEPNGSCAVAGLVCGSDGYCREKRDGGEVCVRRDLNALCAAVECGFVDDGCGVERLCERECPAPQECGLTEPNRCALPSLCTPEGWCWENPLPQGFTLNAGLRLDARHQWLVGENHVVVFFDGERSRLQDVPAPPGVELLGIHGTADNDVFVVGNDGVMLHFDGTRWEREGTLSAFTNQLRTVWSFGDGGALAAGPGGRLLSRAALVDPFSRWTLETFPSTEEIVEVFGDSTGTAWAVTRRNELFTRPPGSASTWTLLDTVPLQDTLTATPRGDGVLFGGTHANRANLVQRDADGGWRQVTDAGFATTGFARGDGGVFVLSGGSEFGWLDEADQFTRFVVQPGQWNAGVALPGPRLLLAGFSGATAVSSLDGGLTWKSTPRVTRGLELNAVCGDSSGARFAVGGIDTGGACATCKVRWLERTSRSSGAQWSSRELQLGNTTQLLGCFAEGPERAWLLGDDSKFISLSSGVASAGDFGGALAGRYKGTWGSVDAGYFFTRLESNEVTVSADGLMGFAASGVNAGGSLRSVWGLGGDDVVVVGVNGASSRFDGVTWTAQNLVTQSELVSVHGARLPDGGSRYVAAGTRGTIYSVQGDAGSLTELNTTIEFRGTWVSQSGRAWAVGKAADGDALVMRAESSGAWVVEPLASTRVVSGVFGADQEDGGVTLWLTGPQGMILRKVE